MLLRVQQFADVYNFGVKDAKVVMVLTVFLQVHYISPLFKEASLVTEAEKARKAPKQAKAHSTNFLH
jgi:hypothetical protein